MDAILEHTETKADQLLGSDREFMQLVEKSGFVFRSQLVGSAVTCSPPPKDSDVDVLVYCHRDNLTRFLLSHGFAIGGSGLGSAEFCSFKSEQSRLNFIITENKEFHDRFVLATHVCKKLNVMERGDRITVFQAILYGKQV